MKYRNQLRIVQSVKNIEKVGYCGQDLIDTSWSNMHRQSRIYYKLYIKRKTKQNKTKKQKQTNWWNNLLAFWGAKQFISSPIFSRIMYSPIKERFWFWFNEFFNSRIVENADQQKKKNKNKKTKNIWNKRRDKIKTRLENRIQEKILFIPAWKSFAYF